MRSLKNKFLLQSLAAETMCTAPLRDAIFRQTANYSLQSGTFYLSGQFQSARLLVLLRLLDVRSQLLDFFAVEFALLFQVQQAGRAFRPSLLDSGKISHALQRLLQLDNLSDEGLTALRQPGEGVNNSAEPQGLKSKCSLNDLYHHFIHLDITNYAIFENLPQLFLDQNRGLVTKF